jgi:uncharacterized protein YjbI with pentapeptide repeats
MPPLPDSKHVELLRRGVVQWNANRPAWPNLADADLDHLDLREANLAHAGMWGCNLHGSDLSGAILDHADLAHANLTRTRLVGTSLDGTDLFGAWVYGAAIWDIRGVPKDDWLSIQPDGSRYWEDDAVKLRVSGIKTAQFMYAMATRGDPGRNGAAVGELVEALGRVTVLLLGRFSEERKLLLSLIQEILLNTHALLPVIFDFAKPSARDLTETVMFLATSSRLIIADLTDPASVPHELASIVPQLPSVPVFPIIAKGQAPYAMFEHLTRYPWVTPVYEYESETDLASVLPELLRQADKAIGAK